MNRTDRLCIQKYRPLPYISMVENRDTVLGNRATVLTILGEDIVWRCPKVVT